MKCLVCGRDLTRTENDDLICKPEKDHTGTFNLTSNKAGCGAFYSYIGYKFYTAIEEFHANKDKMLEDINKRYPNKFKPVQFGIKLQ